MKPQIVTQVKINGEWTDIPLDTARDVVRGTVKRAAANIGYTVAIKEKTA